MKEQIIKLVKLQDIDDEAIRIRVRIEDSTKRLKGHEAKLADVDRQVAALTEKKDDLAKRQRTLEAEAEDNRRLIKRSQERLMSIKNSREYRALQREIDDGKRRISEMEDQTVAFMEEIEGLDKELAALMEERGDLDAIYRQEKDSVESEVSEGQKRLTELDASKDEVAKDVPSDLFSRYQLILRSAGGRAVVPVITSVCKGCNMNIPPQVYNELQRGEELKQCPHCERIIYWKQEE